MGSEMCIRDRYISPNSTKQNAKYADVLEKPDDNKHICVLNCATLRRLSLYKAYIEFCKHIPHLRSVHDKYFKEFQDFMNIPLVLVF